MIHGVCPHSWLQGLALETTWISKDWMGFQSKQGFPFDLGRLICVLSPQHDSRGLHTSRMGYLTGAVSLSEQVCPTVCVQTGEGKTDFRIYLGLIWPLVKLFIVMWTFLKLLLFLVFSIHDSNWEKPTKVPIKTHDGMSFSPKTFRHVTSHWIGTSEIT